MIKALLFWGVFAIKASEIFGFQGLFATSFFFLWGKMYLVRNGCIWSFSQNVFLAIAILRIMYNVSFFSRWRMFELFMFVKEVVRKNFTWRNEDNLWNLGMKISRFRHIERIFWEHRAFGAFSSFLKIEILENLHFCITLMKMGSTLLIKLGKSAWGKSLSSWKQSFSIVESNPYLRTPI